MKEIFRNGVLLIPLAGLMAWQFYLDNARLSRQLLDAERANSAQHARSDADRSAIHEDLARTRKLIDANRAEIADLRRRLDGHASREPDRGPEYQEKLQK